VDISNSLMSLLNRIGESTMTLRLALRPLLHVPLTSPMLHH